MRVLRARAFLSVLLLTSVVGAAATLGQPRFPRLKDRMTAAEFERCGLQKLTAAELAALEEWLAARYGTGGAAAAPSSVQRLPATPAQEASPSDQLVSFNVSSGKYHCPACVWAQRCTRNCVTIPLSEARRRGVPCRVCGGACR